MIIRGSIKATIGGRERLFVFNNNVFIEYAERYGEGNLVSFNNHYRDNFMKAQRNMLYLALLEGDDELRDNGDKEGNALPDNFSEKTISRWDMEMTDLTKVIKAIGDAFNFGTASMQMQDNFEEEAKKK